MNKLYNLKEIIDSAICTRSVSIDDAVKVGLAFLPISDEEKGCHYEISDEEWHLFWDVVDESIHYSTRTKFNLPTGFASKVNFLALTSSGIKPLEDIYDTVH